MKKILILIFFFNFSNAFASEYVTSFTKEVFDQVYIPDGYVDILKASFMLNNKKIHGDKMIGFESPECTEVDSIEEFDYIQYQINNNGSLLLDYLNKTIK